MPPGLFGGASKEAEMSDAATKLGEYDFIVVVDASGSMANAVSDSNPKSRWNYIQETVGAFAADVGRIDSDGIGLVIFGGSNITKLDSVTAKQVNEAFASRRPSGSTPLTEALEAAFAMAGKSDKKDFIVVFTDGTPDDKDGAAKAIIKHANKQETDDACTVLFVQVGDDAAASAYLKSLDDDLKGAKFDIVDAKTVAETEKFSSTAELVLAAIAD